MASFNRSRNKAVRCLAVAGLTTSVVCLPALADVWVFDPSISLDQRLDDNYYLIADADGNLAATRAVGELGVSRESQSASYRGLARIDALLTTTNDNGDEGLDSNQYLAFDAKLRSARSRYGVLASFKQDTPSRDIAADLSDTDSLSTDTGLDDLSQSSNVGRQEYIIEPKFDYDLSRRLILTTKATLSQVNHDLPDTQDAIYRQYIAAFPRLADGSFDGTPLSYSEVTIEDAGKPFTPSGELDDYNENEIDIGLRFKQSTITTLTATASYSHYTAEVEPNAYAIIPFGDLVSDPSEKDILRKPKRDAVSTTATFKLGYERSLTPTLKFVVDGGVYTNTTDESDTLRAEDRPGEEIPQDLLDSLESNNDGWLASVSLTYDAGQTRYTVKYAVDVEPSSSGSQVETNELTGDLQRTISPRLNFSLRGRAYEPDRLGVNQDDEYARRFISVEPRIEWKAARNWTIAAAYRYRRQKARIAAASAESNAILLSLKYTLPSEVRDEAKANGL
ncbi:hypothetical protein [Granulosicoccus antarcticus]|uniref:TIGR03016 family PEP-CTERM system-associated outer membrane protein n=1 Tax=Granulosicoccus antarcticus IMCC3135 TaxID=1192854 RepID=A0A2Z2P0W7_9GAMM|nr:hypothetical protein [Granulosicoccus antarcticus]ASJ76425.1 hypothetical protein IMCC3135_31890 [Granulosicoccus antarcticus IMCC3135]